MNKIIRQIFAFFLKGLIIVLPFWLSGYIIFWGIAKVDSVVDFGFPGGGVLVVLFSITLAGFLVTTFITEPIYDFFDKILGKVPAFKLLFTSIKDMMNAIVGDEKKFTEPVLVKINDSGIKRIGFVTQKDLSKLTIEGHVAVYFPWSYTFTGNLYIVPIENITPINANPAEVMKFALSGGVSEI